MRAALAAGMATHNPRSFAVITGASSGIGFELAKQCLEHDFDLLICAEDVGLAGAAEQLTALGKGSVEHVRADLASYEGVEQLYSQIKARGRAVDALLLNAGVGVGGAFVDTDLRAELNMVALDCNHTIAKRVAPAMVAHFFERADLMDTKVGQAKKDDPAQVAAQGFAAMMKGKDSVLGGSFKSRMGLMNEPLPETVKAKQAGKTTRPGSANSEWRVT